MSAFIDGSMADEQFRTSFMKVFRRAEISGMVISISENIIKLTAPGSFLSVSAMILMFLSSSISSL